MYSSSLRFDGQHHIGLLEIGGQSSRHHHESSSGPLEMILSLSSCERPCPSTHAYSLFLHLGSYSIAQQIHTSTILPNLGLTASDKAIIIQLISTFMASSWAGKVLESIHVLRCKNVRSAPTIATAYLGRVPDGVSGNALFDRIKNTTTFVLSLYLARWAKEAHRACS